MDGCTWEGVLPGWVPGRVYYLGGHPVPYYLVPPGELAGHLEVASGRPITRCYSVWIHDSEEIRPKTKKVLAYSPCTDASRRPRGTREHHIYVQNGHIWS